MTTIPTTMPGVSADDYTTTMTIDGTPEAVYDALTTTSGLAAWWTPVAGSGTEAGELAFDMDAQEGPLVIDVRAARPARLVVWEVHACPFLPDWDRTTILFDLGRGDSGRCELFFRHHGLTPQLDCYDMCRQGWDHFLPSLRDYVVTGTGSPLGSPADNARRSR